MDFISSFRKCRSIGQLTGSSFSVCDCHHSLTSDGYLLLYRTNKMWWEEPKGFTWGWVLQNSEKGTLQSIEKQNKAAMICQENTIHYGSWAFVVGGLLYLLRQMTTHTPYGRYVDTKSPGIMVPARAGWFIQELPSFLVPVLLILTTECLPGIGRLLLLWTFCLHYFQR